MTSFAVPGSVALLVGLVELLGIPGALGARGGFWSLVDGVNDHFELLGIAPGASEMSLHVSSGPLTQ